MSITSFREDSATKRTLELEVSPERTEEVMSEVANRYRNRVKLPGFRPGKVPVKVVRQRFAEEIRQDALERLVPEVLFGALKEKGIDPVTSPSVEDLHFHDGEPLRFRAVVEIRPEIELGIYRGLPAPELPVEPTEEEVRKVLEDIASHNATYVPVEGRAAMRGDYVVVDIHGTFPNGDGEAFHNEKVFLELGNERNFEEINDLLQGRVAGERITFDKTFPAEFDNERIAGKALHFEVELAEVKEKQAPEVDDELAASSGLAPNLAELRQRITDDLRRRKQHAANRGKETAILEQLRKSHSFEVPAGLVETELENRLRRLADQLAEAGADAEKAGLDWKEIRAKQEPEARDRVAERLILDAIAAKEQIEAADAEVEAEIVKIAREVRREARDLRADFARRGILEELRADIRRHKVLAELVASAHADGSRV